MVLGKEYLSLTHKTSKVADDAQEPGPMSDPVYVCNPPTCAIEEPSQTTFHQDTFFREESDILKELERRTEGTLDKRDNVEYGVHALTIPNQLPDPYVNREQAE